MNEKIKRKIPKRCKICMNCKFCSEEWYDYDCYDCYCWNPELRKHHVEEDYSCEKWEWNGSQLTDPDTYTALPVNDYKYY